MNVIVTAKETSKTKGNYKNKTSFYCFSAEFRTMEYSAYIIHLATHWHKYLWCLECVKEKIFTAY